MKRLGIVFVALGVLALVLGGVGYNRQRTIVDVGPIKATATEHHVIPVSPIVGVLAIVGGLVLLVVPKPRAA